MDKRTYCLEERLVFLVSQVDLRFKLKGNIKIMLKAMHA